jgi:ketosteroid isomerase-like protein
VVKLPIRTVADFEAFFAAYNERNWDVLFQYVSDDCVWNAAEQCVQGRQAMEWSSPAMKRQTARLISQPGCLV